MNNTYFIEAIEKEKVTQFHLTRIIGKPHQFIQTLGLMIELSDKNKQPDEVSENELRITMMGQSFGVSTQRVVWNWGEELVRGHIGIGMGLGMGLAQIHWFVWDTIWIRPSNANVIYFYRGLHSPAGGY